MALTAENIALIKENLRAHEEQERRALAEFQSAERKLRQIRQAIAAERTIIAYTEGTTAERGCFS